MILLGQATTGTAALTALNRHFPSTEFDVLKLKTSKNVRLKAELLAFKLSTIAIQQSHEANFLPSHVYFVNSQLRDSRNKTYSHKYATSI